MSEKLDNGGLSAEDIKRLEAENIMHGGAATCDAFIAKRHAYIRFCAEHGIDGTLKYESSLYKFWALVVISVGGETIVNSYMYAQASDLGWVGGTFVAFTLSAFIFGLSFGAGVVLTWKNARLKLSGYRAYKVSGKRYKIPPASDNTGQKHTLSESEDNLLPYWKQSTILSVAAWTGFLVMGAFVGLLIAVVCIYRDEAVTWDPSSGASIMSETFNRIVEFNLLPTAGIESFIMIGVNLFIMGLGMYKGYYYFSRVPRYKEHLEELEKSRSEFKAFIKSAKLKVKKEISKLQDKQAPSDIQKLREIEILLALYEDESNKTKTDTALDGDSKEDQEPIRA